MADSSIFISSCSKRQLARRRPARRGLRSQLPLLALILAATCLACLAYVAGHGGI
jgi:hypothetical protein